jgi:hypothetical protein
MLRQRFSNYPASDGMKLLLLANHAQPPARPAVCGHVDETNI